ncbi:MAG TPA: TonB-dependent receptor, partial [Nitrospiria bacterium]|nr:TonB-dependent receptor [Nitrospiria bacterium]
GGVSSVYIRGADPNHTVVIIDGIKVNDPMNSRGGSFDFSTLNTDSIERIEVVRGPLSSVYGSDAIAGAVHIITRRPASEPEARLEISGGSFGYHRALLEARGTKNRFEYSLGGSFLDNGEPVKGSGFTTRAFQARTEVGVTYRTGIHSSIRYAESRMEAFPDDSGGPEYAVIRASDDRNAEELLLGLGLSHLPYSKFSVTLQADYFDRSETVDSPGVAPGIRDPFGVPPKTVDNDFYRTRVSLENRWEATDAFHITLGGIFEAEEGESTGLLMFPGPSIPVDFELRRDLWAAFLEGRYKAGNYLTFEGAGRWDDSEDFDPQFSPRAGFSFLIPASGTHLIADWGKGFKLPAFFSLSHPIVGNPDLGPEKSLSWEWGISQSLLNRRVRVHAIYFSSRIEDGIDLDEGPPPRLVNRDAIKAHGIEVGGT